MALLPELARDSHLDTHVAPEHCIHSFVESPTITRREVWKRTKHIGTGGFGTVWLETCIQGHEKEDGALRAVKVLQLPPGAQVDPQRGIITYGRELEALAKFSHKKYSRCFVKFHGWYEHASTVSICLDYLPLGDLRTFLAKRSDPRLPEPEVQQIISQVLDGLVFMHTGGFAHRDLKPSNILIQTPGPDSWWVKLSDFGLSKRTEETRGATGPLGTPGFMAPELLGLVPNAPKTSNGIKWCPADLWCLGETAFQLLTGKPTFPDLGTLAEYGGGRCEFPASKLHDAMASLAMVEFVSMIMFADYTQRPTAEAASAHRWLQDYK
ncbi:kinase-like protein, partial [Thozetella sp. PMI_491]